MRLSTAATAAALLGLAPPAAAQTPLADAVPQFGYLNQGEWAYYSVQVEGGHAQTGFGIKSLDSGNPDLYVRRGALPTLAQYDFRPYRNSLYEVVYVNESSSPALATDTWYVGVHGRTAGNYGVAARRDVWASSRSGMGSTPYAGGTSFRVWAPNANAAYVTGDFNGWSQSPMASEANGNWSLDFRGASAGQQYKYVLHNGAQVLHRTDARSEQVTSSVGNSVIFDQQAFDWTGDGFVMPPWNELVFYELHVGTFNDSPGGTPGTFWDAINRLDHLRDLGITAIEVMPIAEFPADFSWGYNPSQPYAVETAYGGPAAYKAFVKEAHLRGMAVVQDLVFNHWGPSDMDLWRYDGWEQFGYGGIYFYNDYRSSTPWGDTRPDYGRSEVRDYIRDNAMMWLQDFHVDGLRFDGTSWIRKVDGMGEDIPDGWSLMQWINDEVDWNQGWKYIVAEDMRNDSWLTNPTSTGGAGFDGQWDAQFVHPIRDAIIQPTDAFRDMHAVRDAMEHRYGGDAFERIIFTESHDEVANGRSRVAEEIWPGNAGSWFSRKRSTIGAALVMTTPGVPLIFQGQEFLEDGYFDDGDPVDWSKLTTYGGINLLYRDLIRLRRDWFNNTRGLRGQNQNVHHINNSDKLLAFHRYDVGGPGDDVIVIVNFADRTWNDYWLGFPAGGLWYTRFNSDAQIYSGDYGNFGSSTTTAFAGGMDGMGYSASISIAPYSVLILSQ